MNKSQDRKTVNRILQIAFKVGTKRDLAERYGAMVAEFCLNAEHSARWWPKIKEEVESVNRYSRRGEWWPCVYNMWAVRLLRAAKEDGFLISVEGTSVDTIEDNVPEVDRVEMLKQYEQARLKARRKTFVDVNAV